MQTQTTNGTTHKKNQKNHNKMRDISGLALTRPTIGAS
jgi:hypothetical protein